MFSGLPSEGGRFSLDFIRTWPDKGFGRLKCSVCTLEKKRRKKSRKKKKKKKIENREDC